MYAKSDIRFSGEAIEGSAGNVFVRMPFEQLAAMAAKHELSGKPWSEVTVDLRATLTLVPADHDCIGGADCPRCAIALSELDSSN
jgi:hypothetical protein